MQRHQSPWPDPAGFVVQERPDDPVLLLAPAALQAQARRFRAGFAGLVTYAVKANPRPEVLANLVAAGITAFDVASPQEMAAVRAVHGQAVLHYNNPVRSEAEIARGVAAGVASWSVDDPAELDKLAPVPQGAEIAVRFALPVAGAAYDFGAKFGADPDLAARLLARVAASGRVPALAFHPGTQCTDAGAWRAYIRAAAGIARAAGLRLARLNVGGGFAADRDGSAPAPEPVLAAIAEETARAFGPAAPALLCEPGRAMVAEAASLLTRVKTIRRDGAAVYLNDGIYGGLADLRDMGPTARIRVLDPEGRPRRGAPVARTLFGPTCDSLDRLPEGMTLPADTRPGDYVLFDGMGAYSLAMSTAFNGYGVARVATVLSLAGHPRAAG